MQLLLFVIVSIMTAILPSIYRKLGKCGKKDKKNSGQTNFFDIEMDHEDDTHDHRVYMDDDFASKNTDKRDSTVRFAEGAVHRNEHEVKIREQDSFGGPKKKNKDKRYSELHYKRAQIGSKLTLWEGGTRGLGRLPTHDDFGIKSLSPKNGKKEPDQDVELGAVNPGLL